MNHKFGNKFFPIQTKLAGVSFGDCQENIKKWGCPEYGIYDLIHEMDNPYDSNAVRVITLDSHAMGYLRLHQQNL